MKRNSKLVDQLVTQDIAPFLAEHGFREKTSERFQRPWNNCLHVVNLNIGKVTPQQFWLTIDVGVIFPEINRILEFADYASDRMTVGSPLHELMPPPSDFFEWELTRKSDLEGLAADMREKIMGFAFPFLLGFSDLDQVASRLESTDSDDWFSLDGQSRFLVLAAIYCNDGKKSKAIDLIKNGIEQERLSHEKYSYWLKAFLRRLTG